MPPNAYLADFSLAVVNRTGAYYVCKEVVDGLPEFFPAIRYWRTFSRAVPPQNIALKVKARLMMAELAGLRGNNMFQWPKPANCGSLPTVFFDPLYVLRCQLHANDIVLCHDVGPISHPELFNAGTCSLYREAYEKIKHIKPGMVFVSQASQRAFETFFGSDYRFMKVIRLFTRHSAVDGDSHSVNGLSKPFTLSVGALETRKNYERIIEAFRRSGLASKNVTHVICGPRGHGHENISNAAAQTPGIRLLGRVSDEQLRWLYNNAAGFVLPSLLEGFGVPAIEASHKGVVSVVSANSAQEEAIGGNGICVDPCDIDKIAESFRQLFEMPDIEKQKLSLQASEFAKSWTRDDYLDAWRGVLTSNGVPQ